jgi:hypothetical protein
VPLQIGSDGVVPLALSAAVVVLDLVSPTPDVPAVLEGALSVSVCLSWPTVAQRLVS